MVVEEVLILNVVLLKIDNMFIGDMFRKDWLLSLGKEKDIEVNNRI